MYVVGNHESAGFCLLRMLAMTKLLNHNSTTRVSILKGSRIKEAPRTGKDLLKNEYKFLVDANGMG